MTISLPTSIPGTYVPEGSGATVSTDATLTGDGSTGSPLGLVVPVSVADGGTNAITAAAALANLGGVGAGSHSLKRGSGSADYSITATSFADIDTTNLNITATVPSGSIAIAFFMSTSTSASAHNLNVGIAVDGTVLYKFFQSGNVAQPIPNAVMAVLVGDGASHTFKPQAFMSGASTGQISNGDSVVAPIHLLLIVPAT